MKLRRILTGAAIGAATATAFRSFVMWELPWDWNWDANGEFIRVLIAWAGLAGATLGAVRTRTNGGRT